MAAPNARRAFTGFEEETVIEHGIVKLTKLAEVALIVASATCFLVFGYFTYWYVWTEERQFTHPAGIVVSVVAPLLLAVAFLYALRLSSNHKINVAVSLASLVFCLYSLELLSVMARRFVGAFDARTRLDIVRDLRSRGIEAVPAVFPLALLNERESSLRSAITINDAEVLPLGGIARKFTVMCNESGDWITYTSDEHGFNNPAGIWRSKEMTIAALGDSFTFGACVPAEKNFVATIRNSYPATLNLGINGAGPLVELAALKEFLPSFQPRVTLWFYVEVNDQDDLKLKKRSPLLMRYLRQNFTQRLAANQSAIDVALSRFVESRMQEDETKALVNNVRTGVNLLKLSNLRNALGVVQGRSQTEAKFDANEIQSTLFREILQHARASVRAWSGQLYFVYLPSWERYSNRRSEGDHREAILALVEALGIPHIDIHQAFEKAGDPLRFFPFRRQGHYNEEGHRVVAETVLRRLNADGPGCGDGDASANGCGVNRQFMPVQYAQ